MKTCLPVLAVKFGFSVVPMKNEQVSNSVKAICKHKECPKMTQRLNITKVRSSIYIKVIFQC